MKNRNKPWQFWLLSQLVCQFDAVVVPLSDLLEVECRPLFCAILYNTMHVIAWKTKLESLYRSYLFCVPMEFWEQVFSFCFCFFFLYDNQAYFVICFKAFWMTCCLHNFKKKNIFRFWSRVKRLSFALNPLTEHEYLGKTKHKVGLTLDDSTSFVSTTKTAGFITACSPGAETREVGLEIQNFN